MTPAAAASYAALALFAGVMIPVMAALSGALGRGFGNPAYAALITAGVGFAGVLAFTLISGAQAPSLTALRAASPLQLAAGLGMALYICSITFLAPRFGVGNAIMLVVAGQIISAAFIDHWGLFGGPHKPIDWLRAFGLVVMVIGVAIAQLAANGGPKPS